MVRRTGSYEAAKAGINHARVKTVLGTNDVGFVEEKRKGNDSVQAR